MPFKYPEHAEHFFDGLRKGRIAGKVTATGLALHRKFFPVEGLRCTQNSPVRVLIARKRRNFYTARVIRYRIVTR